MEEGKNMLLFLLFLQALAGGYSIWFGANKPDDKLKDFDMLTRLIIAWIGVLCFDFYITTKYTMELTVGKGAKEILSAILFGTGLMGLIISFFGRRLPVRLVWILTGVLMIVWPLVVIALSRL